MSRCWAVTTIVLCSLLKAPVAQAGTNCQPTPQGTLCISEVDFLRFSQIAFMTQANSQWCWAASLSMVYSFYQHPISQQRIVSEVYGGLQNVPASSYTIASKLNGCFRDDQGAMFQSRIVASYDSDAGVHLINNQTIISALNDDRPLIIGTRSHAMVLTAIQYFQTPSGPNVVAAGVFDPWPGQGARGLQMDELYPAHLGGSLRFLALPQFSDTCASPPFEEPEPPGGEEDSPPIGCNSVAQTQNAMIAILMMIFLSARRWRRRV